MHRSTVAGIHSYAHSPAPPLALLSTACTPARTDSRLSTSISRKNIYPEIIKFRVHLERWIARSAPLGVACHHSVLRANSLYCFPFLATNRPAMPWELVRFGRLFSGVGLLISQPSRFLLRALLHLTPTCLFCWSCCHRHRRH